MERRPLFTALVLALCAPALGCLAYNDSCTPLVDDPDAVVGYLGEDVFLDKPFARHANNALGQLSADALLHAEDGSSKPAELGVVNGGSLRAEGLCVTRSSVRKGPLTDGVLHEIMLFENLVVTVDLTEKQLVDVFENSVGALYSEGQYISSPSGAFLHVSEGTSVRVDCSHTKGQRIRELKVGSRVVQIPARTDESIRYRVAMSAFLLGGGDGYGAILGSVGQDPARNPVQARKLGGTDVNLTAAYMKEKYPNASQALTEAPRVVFENCALPVRPATR
ncbi:5'-nucleotidase C-terminal domain-containing protein [Myxococcaceae bacterium JPH2]|nr:5'-nucleotidase C-terminal domain-containing protein [Myxococcaceae bacterium JPH2]